MVLGETMVFAAGGMVGLSVLYFAASIADSVFGQTRKGGEFGPNRTTIIETWLKRIGALVVLVVLGLLVTGL